MAKFDKLAEAFDRQKEGKAAGALRRSLAVIGAVEKLQNQGIEVTQKAKMDYLLALRFVEKASNAAGRDLIKEHRSKQQTMGPPAPAKTKDSSTVKRNPKDHPAEFQKAITNARKIVEQVEALQQAGEPVPLNLMETYSLCKKFLDKYK